MQILKFLNYITKISDYNKFVKALSKDEDTSVHVNKYLKFSNAIVSGKDVLCVDIKVETDTTDTCNNVFIPGVHDKVYLDITDTRLDTLLTKLENLKILENTDKILQKFVAYLNKSNLEFTIKTVKKSPVSNKNKRTDDSTVLK